MRTPRSRTPLSSSTEQTTLGMAPIPIWTQDPARSRRRSGAPRAVDVGRGRVPQLRCRRVVTFDNVVDLADVHAVHFAIDMRQSRGRLDNDRFRTLYDGAMPEIGGTEVEGAVFVRRAGLEHDDVDGIDEAAIVVRHLAEVEWNVIAEAGVMLGAVIAAEMPVERMEMLTLGSASRKARGFRERQDRIFTLESSAARAARALSNTSG